MACLENGPPVSHERGSLPVCATISTLECTLLSERSQTQEASDAGVPFIGPSGKRELGNSDCGG